MALKNRTIYAILGILSLSPSTGYDIKRYCDNVLYGFWNENFGHIYPTLKKMLEDGLIEDVNQENGERKIIYGITKKGKLEFENWLAEETLQQPVRSEFMLKLLFSSNQPNEKVVDMLNDYKKKYIEKIKIYKKMQDELKKESEEISKKRKFFLMAVLKRGIISSEAVITWCEEITSELEKIK